MCRWICYRGPAVPLSQVLTEPHNSLVRQSIDGSYLPFVNASALYDPKQCKLRNNVVNGDGFGFSVYLPKPHRLMEKIGDEIKLYELWQTVLFKTTMPAWSDANVIDLANALCSHCIMGHVRAATPGLPISRQNTHPFKHGRWTFMHNGGVSNVAKLRRKILNSLSDDLYAVVMGTTDSELAFSVFLSHPEIRYNASPRSHRDDRLIPLDTLLQYDHPSINKQQEKDWKLAYLENRTAGQIASAMEGTLSILVALQLSLPESLRSPSSLNFCVTDGDSIVATRFRDHKEQDPPTLYLAIGTDYRCENGDILLDQVDDAKLLDDEGFAGVECHQVGASYSQRLIPVTNVTTEELPTDEVQSEWKPSPSLSFTSTRSDSAALRSTRLETKSGRAESVIVASEPLTKDEWMWKIVAKDSLVVVAGSLHSSELLETLSHPQAISYVEIRCLSHLYD